MTLKRVLILVFFSILALLAWAAPSRASSFGASWDGNPPGNIAQQLGTEALELGHAEFDPGRYALTFVQGTTAWRDLTTVTFGDQRLDPGYFGARPFGLTMDTAWTIHAWTPSVTDAQSTGQQWAWLQTGANSWSFGFEDIAVGRGDQDYNDLTGYLVRLPDPDPPYICPEPTPTVLTSDPVPEPETMWLVGTALILLWRGVSRPRP